MFSLYRQNLTSETRECGILGGEVVEIGHRLLKKNLPFGNRLRSTHCMEVLYMNLCRPAYFASTTQLFPHPKNWPILLEGGGSFSHVSFSDKLVGRKL